MDDLPSFNCDRGEEEEDDEWVVVKKQRFTILIPPPPPSPLTQQIMTEMRAKKPKEAPIAANKKGRAKNGNKNGRSSSCSSWQAGVYGDGSMGTAVNVVNLRMRAINLERKLGSLPPQLLLQDPYGFMAELSQYQLATLTTSKLKDMGMNTVGRRRKLIHAIDLLCRPYYYTTTTAPEASRDA